MKFPQKVCVFFTVLIINVGLLGTADSKALRLAVSGGLAESTLLYGYVLSFGKGYSYMAGADIILGQDIPIGLKIGGNLVNSDISLGSFSYQAKTVYASVIALINYASPKVPAARISAGAGYAYNYQLSPVTNITTPPTNGHNIVGSAKVIFGSAAMIGFFIEAKYFFPLMPNVQLYPLLVGIGLDF